MAKNDFNKEITIALNKLLRKEKDKTTDGKTTLITFDEKDFANFILELREKAQNYIRR